MSEYTKPDMCLRCDSPTSLCQCPQSVLDWYEYTEILLAENRKLKVDVEDSDKALDKYWKENKRLSVENEILRACLQSSIKSAKDTMLRVAEIAAPRFR